MSFYVAGTTPALNHTRSALLEAGITVTDSPRWNTDHLLLDVPSFRPGSAIHIDTLLCTLPQEITIWGGNLHHPALEGYRCIDLLKDEGYLLENASITADCAITLIEPLLKENWSQTRCLVIGWGRIGKFLSEKLSNLSCHVTVATRKDPYRIQLKGLGYRAVDMKQMKEILTEFDLIINTAPADILSNNDLSGCEACLKVDLASRKGISSDDVIWARGLPGIHAPERSGRLIANTILRILKEGEK